MILSLEEFWIQTSSKNKSQWVGGWGVKVAVGWGGCESRSGLREGGKSQWVGGESRSGLRGGGSSDVQTLPLNPPLEGGWPYTQALYQT